MAIQLQGPQVIDLRPGELQAQALRQQQTQNLIAAVGEEKQRKRQMIAAQVEPYIKQYGMEGFAALNPDLARAYAQELGLPPSAVNPALELGYRIKQGERNPDLFKALQQRTGWNSDQMLSTIQVLAQYDQRQMPPAPEEASLSGSFQALPAEPRPGPGPGDGGGVPTNVRTTNTATQGNKPSQPVAAADFAIMERGAMGTTPPAVQEQTEQGLWENRMLMAQSEPAKVQKELSELYAVIDAFTPAMQQQDPELYKAKLREAEILKKALIAANVEVPLSRAEQNVEIARQQRGYQPPPAAATPVERGRNPGPVEPATRKVSSPIGRGEFVESVRGGSAIGGSSVNQFLEGNLPSSGQNDMLVQPSPTPGTARSNLRPELEARRLELQRLSQIPGMETAYQQKRQELLSLEARIAAEERSGGRPTVTGSNVNEGVRASPTTMPVGSTRSTTPGFGQGTLPKSEITPEVKSRLESRIAELDRQIASEKMVLRTGDSYDRQGAQQKIDKYQAEVDQLRSNLNSSQVTQGGLTSGSFTQLAAQATSTASTAEQAQAKQAAVTQLQDAGKAVQQSGQSVVGAAGGDQPLKLVLDAASSSTVMKGLEKRLVNDGEALAQVAKYAPTLFDPKSRDLYIGADGKVSGKAVAELEKTDAGKRALAALNGTAKTLVDSFGGTRQDKTIRLAMSMLSGAPDQEIARIAKQPNRPLTQQERLNATYTSLMDSILGGDPVAQTLYPGMASKVLAFSKEQAEQAKTIADTYWTEARGTGQDIENVLKARYGDALNQAQLASIASEIRYREAMANLEWLKYEASKKTGIDMGIITDLLKISLSVEDTYKNNTTEQAARARSAATELVEKLMLQYGNVKGTAEEKKNLWVFGTGEYGPGQAKPITPPTVVQGSKPTRMPTVNEMLSVSTTRTTQK